MSTFKTAALSLYKTRLNEADRIYVLYTEEYGKIEARIRASARSSSKLAGGLEPVSLSQVMIVKGKYFETIAGVQMLKHYEFSAWPILQQLALVREIFYRLIKPGLPEPRLYQKLASYLEAMSLTNSTATARFLTQRFIWQTLDLLGLSSSAVAVLKKNQETSILSEPELLNFCLQPKVDNFVLAESALKDLEIFTRQYFLNITENDLKSFSF